MVKIIMIYNFKQKKCNQKVAYLKKNIQTLKVP